MFVIPKEKVNLAKPPTEKSSEPKKNSLLCKNFGMKNWKICNLQYPQSLMAKLHKLHKLTFCSQVDHPSPSLKQLMIILFLEVCKLINSVEKHGFKYWKSIFIKRVSKCVNIFLKRWKREIWNQLVSIITKVMFMALFYWCWDIVALSPLIRRGVEVVGFGLCSIGWFIFIIFSIT